MTLASLLKAQGYTTGCFGKWHLGIGEKQADWNAPLQPGPCEVGFDHYFGIPTSHNWGPYVWVNDHEVAGRPPGLVLDSKTRPAPPVGRVDEEVGPTLTKKVTEYIEANKDRPFFIYYASAQPHEPFTPNAQFQGKSGGGKLGDWIVEWDWTVGQVMATLDRLKLTDNTLLIVTSDNGGLSMASCGPLRGERGKGKGSIYEAGHRVPFIVRWPGHVPAGTTCDETICVTDLLATFAAIHGTALPEHAGEDSCNVLPAFRGEKTSSPLRGYSVFLGRAIREGPWKLITGKQTELYNLADDLGERNNVAKDHPDIVQRLTDLLDADRKRGSCRLTDRRRGEVEESPPHAISSRPVRRRTARPR